MKTILFQGDSITDAGRDRENIYDLGTGYPRMTAGIMGAEYPQEYKFINKGISGNRVVDLYARWKIDCLNLKPDYLSILIGVNDVWHDFYEQPNGVDAVKYEKIYDMLIDETLKALPKIKIMIMEPYLIHGTASDENWEIFSREVALRRKAANNIAEKYALPIIHLQEELDKACEKAPASNWSEDGVHPVAAGHYFIAKKWIEAFEKNFR